MTMKKRGGASSKDAHRKAQLNMRISDEGRAILDALAKHYGLTLIGVFELLLREKAREVGFKVRHAPGGFRAVLTD